MKKIRQAAPKKVAVTKKRHWLFHSVEQLVGFIFFLFVIVISIWVVNTLIRWMDNPEQVVLSQLTITGEREFTTDEDIREAILALGLPDTFIGQNVDAIQQEVLRVPWIKQVSVRKQWPDKLTVNVVEYQPIAHWNDAFLLDQFGVVFSLPADRVHENALPMLYGPENKAVSVLAMYQHFLSLLQVKDISDNNIALAITAISVNERYSWILRLKPCIKGSGQAGNLLCMENESIEVILGREQLDERLKRFIMLYPEIQAQTPSDERINIVDLRYNNGVAVQRNKLTDLSQVKD